MLVLGIHAGHNATAALLKDGKVVSCVSEERLSRVKNQIGFPGMAIRAVLESNHVGIGDVDSVVVATEDPRSQRINFSCIDPLRAGGPQRRGPKKMQQKFHDLVQYLRYANGKLDMSWLEFRDSFYKMFFYAHGKEKMRLLYAQRLGCQSSKIMFVDHHTCHALATCFNLPQDRQTLIFTLDGEGDGKCATVSIFDGRKLSEIARTRNYSSLGLLYLHVTEHLGMKGNEHEFKVMGLAPYAKPEYSKKVYAILKKAIRLDRESLTFHSGFALHRARHFLSEQLYWARFDSMAAAMQQLTEDLICEWVFAAIERTGISDIAVGGGVFMNVKANMKLAQMPSVRSLFVMPSGADESLVFGACFYGYQKICEQSGKSPKPAPIKDLYLGMAYGEEEVLALMGEEGMRSKYEVRKCSNIEREVAKLLADGKVVARFNGRSEWGARALGNRSLLANPADADVVRVINEMIKGRDFWMPFAASVLQAGAKKYLVMDGKVSAQYMAITFDSTQAGRRNLKAASHPYDFTVRPQVVDKDWNPSYYKILEEFEKLTGISGILNTSFNIHGEPLVESPKDAIHTMENSGLMYLAIGNLFITKKNAQAQRPPIA